MTAWREGGGYENFRDFLLFLQLNNCPICRSPFKALLKVRAMRNSLVGQGVGADGNVTATRIRYETKKIGWQYTYNMAKDVKNSEKSVQKQLKIENSKFTSNNF